MKRWIDRLRLLEKDLQEFAQIDWAWGATEITSSFSGGQPVETWRLYEYFLSTWMDYQNLLSRLRQAKQLNPDLPPLPELQDQRWFHNLRWILDYPTQVEQDLVNHLIGVYERLEQSMEPRSDHPDHVDDEFIDALTDTIIRGEQTIRTSRHILEKTERGPATNLGQLDYRVNRLAGKFADQPQEVREKICDALCIYNANTLNLYHLQTGDEQGLINIIMNRDEHMRNQDLLNSLESRIGAIDGTMRGLVQILGEVGFDELLDDALSDDPVLTGNLGDQGDHGISVIPGKNGSCSRTLLALARGGGRKPAGFEPTLNKVNDYLIRCDEITEFVIFLTDFWDSKKFSDDHHSRFQAWHTKLRKPKKFVFLTVGAPRTRISLLETDLH